MSDLNAIRGMLKTGDPNTPAVNAPVEDRASFIMQVYQHVFGAIVAFGLIETLLFNTGVAKVMYEFFYASQGRWMLLIGAYMVGMWFVSNAASDHHPPARQYAALLGSSAVYALMFAPFLYSIYTVQDAGASIAAAAAITAVGAALLTVIAFVTKRDLSFLRRYVMWGMALALLLIVGSWLFGWNLGVWFSVAMIGLMGAAILYQTQDIVKRYPTTAYVAAAVTLFGSLMTMFWYVLRLVMQLFAGD